MIKKSSRTKVSLKEALNRVGSVSYTHLNSGNPHCHIMLTMRPLDERGTWTAKSKKEWQKQSYLSLGGVGEKALLRFLSDRPNIKTVYLCLDSDQAGNDACSRLAELVPDVV